MSNSHEITFKKLNNSGYSAEPMTWDGNRIRWRGAVLPMKENGYDECPSGVSEVLLLEPIMSEDKWLDAAKITIPSQSSTPVQEFDPEVVRTFVEQPLCGTGVWIGINPEGESYMYIPNETISLKSRRIEGSLVYGEGWVQCWINIGREPLEYVELCMDRFSAYKNEDVIRELVVDAQVSAPMFWGLYHLLSDKWADEDWVVAIRVLRAS